MERYKNLSGQSNVVAYELGQGVITVQFASGPIEPKCMTPTAPA